MWLATAASAAGATGGDDQYALAASHYGAQRWSLAEQEFGRFLAEHAGHPRAAEAAFFLGESLAQQGRYGEAEPYLARFLASDRQHPLAGQALFRWGETAYFRGDFDQARTQLEKFRARYPEHPLQVYALPYLAGALLGLAQDGGADAGQHAATAAALYRQALAQHRQSPLKDSCRFGLARAEHQQGNLQEAAATYQSLLDVSDPSLAIQATYYLATILFQQDQLDAAAQHFAHVITQGPETRWADASHGPLAVCHARAGQMDQARTAFAAWQKQAAGAATADAAADAVVFHLGEAALRQQAWGWAAELFQMLVDSPQSAYRARGLSGKAWAQYYAQQPAASLESFQQLLSEFPQDRLAGEAAYMQARLLEQAQRPDQALAAYLKLLETHPQHPQRATVMLQAAVLLEKQKKFEEAARWYEQVIGTDPIEGSPVDTAIYRLAWLRHDTGRPAEALQQFRTLYQQHRHSSHWPDAVFRLAQGAFQRGDLSRAGELARQLVAADPPHEILAHAIYLQARIARANNDWAAVQKRLNELLAEVPESPLRKTAEFWLAESAFQQDEFQQAQRRFQQLSGQLPQLAAPLQPVVLLRQAQLLAEQKKWPESLQVAQQAKAQFPEFPQRAELDYVMGRGLVAEARFRDARHAFLQAAPRDGSDKSETAAMAQWMIGETYLHQENYDQALREYLRVEALYAYPQWQATALLQAAKCYEKLNQPPEARALYQQIVDKYPNQPVAQQAAQRLRSSLPNNTTPAGSSL